uniref:TATA box-binding protein-like 1 n=1 Tax=Parascaris univalens TaxID=6257 RepID=A0A915A2W4_PARUN
MGQRRTTQMDNCRVSLLKSGVLSYEDQQNAEGKICVEIRNVVCTYALPLHIDLHRVAVKCGNVTLDQGRSVLLKQKRNPLCYVKIYNSGKVYIVGCRSEEECKRAARGIARMVQKGMGKEGQIIRMRNYRICNILATCNMPFGIKIEEMARKYPKNCDYEPELSVGLVWRSADPKATLRIHTTGSITVTGARSEADVVNAIKGIYPLVVQYQSALRLREAVPENCQRPISRKRYTSRNCDLVFNDAQEYQHLVIKQHEQDGQQLSDLVSSDACFIHKSQE